MKKILLFFIVLIAISSVAADPVPPINPLSNVVIDGAVYGNHVGAHQYEYKGLETTDTHIIGIFEFFEPLPNAIAAGVACGKTRCDNAVTAFGEGDGEYQLSGDEFWTAASADKRITDDWFGFDVGLGIDIPVGIFKIRYPATVIEKYQNGIVFLATETGRHGGMFDEEKITGVNDNHGDVNADPQDPPPTTPIPEFSTIGIIVAAVIILCLLVLFIYRKKK
ncbi:PEF-CTERM sorting domain-containing protein [Candidatus Woesearchaeota archaeon]|nr:PEF-CTERM sorting domain-containing protein [Candidatus Woesearchaeota archaeon]